MGAVVQIEHRIIRCLKADISKRRGCANKGWPASGFLGEGKSNGERNMPSTALTQMVMDANTVTTVINNINSLYSNAISQLITYTIGILAFVGIFIPLAISRMQNKQLKADNKALADKVATELAEAKKILIAELKVELSKEVALLDAKIVGIKEELEENISRKSAGLNAKSHHAQGNKFFEGNKNIEAFKEYLIAMKDYAKAKDEGNIQAIVGNLEKVLPKLNQDDFVHKVGLEALAEKAIQMVDSINTNGRYTSDIRKLKEAFQSAQSRVKPT
jgi:hypothetical protein